MKEKKKYNIEKLHEIEKEAGQIKEKDPEFFADAEKAIDKVFDDSNMHNDMLDFLNKK